jgi:hypothetical protein
MSATTVLSRVITPRIDLTTHCHRKDGTITYQDAEGVWHEHVREIPADLLDALPEFEANRIRSHLGIY